MKRIGTGFLLALFAIGFAVNSLRAQGSNATFSWSSGSMNLNVGETKTVVLSINTAGNETTGADVVLNYNTNQIEILGVDFDSNSQLYNQSFFTNNATTGVANLTSTFDNIGQAFNGSSAYATFTIRGKAAGSSQLAFVCSQGATNDTNIMQRLTSLDVLNCSSLSNFGITVAGGSSATPTPTAGPTQPPGATNAPTAAPTNAPTPVPTTTTNSDGTTCSPLQTAPSNLRATAQSSSSVLLNWTKEPNSQYYTLKYGTSASNYQFGALNIGNNDRFLVTNLKAGTTYYFAIAGKNNCSTSPFVTASARTSGGSTGGGTTTTVTPRPNTTTQIVTPTPFIDAPSFDNLITQNTQGLTDSVGNPSVSDEIPGDLGTPEPVEDFLSSGRSQQKGVLPFNLPFPIILGIIAGIVVLCLGIILFVTRKGKVEEPPVSTTDTGAMKEV